MTTPDVAPPPVSPAGPATRDPALVLAGLHLRLGSLALARAELETMAADGELDLPGRVDLAEVRWRTGALVGAGAAAREALAGGDQAVVALVVAAEAAAALGRPSEARRLAGQAMAAMDGPIDPIFAGMPRSGVWPADPAEPVPTPATLFPPDRASVANGDVDTGPVFVLPPMDAAAAAAAAGLAVPGPNDQDPGFWNLADVEDATPDTGAPTAELAFAPPTPPQGLDAAAILDAGEAALATGDLSRAALHLGLAVRVAPSIAPAILDAIGESPDAGLQMVRGDAFRAIGLEDQALRAYAAAMAAAGAVGSDIGAAPADAPGADGPVETASFSPAPDGEGSDDGSTWADDATPWHED